MCVKQQVKVKGVGKVGVGNGTGKSTKIIYKDVAKKYLGLFPKLSLLVVM